MKIQELAKLANVSTATVSRVFSHYPNISDAVRERVFKIAKEYNYHPRLSTKQRNIVLIIPYHSENQPHCCVEMLLMALTVTLPELGFRIEILPMDNLERLDRIQFCAAIAIGAESKDFQHWDDRFAVPLILLDRKSDFQSKNVFVVRSDEFQGMALAIHELLKAGRDKIGCIIHGAPGTGNADLRYEGIQTAFKKHDLQPTDPFIKFSSDEQYLENIGLLLQQNVNGLFCPGGNGGIISTYALNLFHKKIPEDVSLISSEQIFFSRYGIPPQTTITQNYSVLAQKAADIILDRLNNRMVQNETIIPYLLIHRLSVSSFFSKKIKKDDVLLKHDLKNKDNRCILTADQLQE
ncbi:MAG: LacI family DNA-binding transcriptional regulator [Lentisphaeria bacterium]